MGRSVVRLLLATLLVLVLLGPARADTAEDFQVAKRQAHQLFTQNKFPEALPLLERLHSERADDIAVLEELAGALAGYATTWDDDARRRPVLIRAHQLAQRAKDLGDNSYLIQLVLQSIPADGSYAGPRFSPRLEVNAAMQAGEAAYGKGEMTAAIEHYKRASALDPMLYDAPLFIGDAYFKLNDPDRAGEWYKRAMAIDPDRETAYRYWGDVLARQGKFADARLELINAIVAEPYSRSVWSGVGQWADMARVRLIRLQLDLPKFDGAASDSAPSNADPRLADPRNPWWAYIATRKKWQSPDVFRMAYPAETQYRRSLLEMADALNAVCEKASASTITSQSDKSLAILLELKGKGLIESHVLFGLADQGIAKDYVGYRGKHRDALKTYLAEYVVPALH